MKKLNEYEKMLNFVFQKMDSNNVFYHTKKHIVDVLNEAEEIFNKKDFHSDLIELQNIRYFNKKNGVLKMPFAAFFAISFHDVIYEVGSTNNEYESAKLMIDYFAAHTNKDFLEKHHKDIVLANKIILATKNHKPINDNKFSEFEKYVAHICLDADMSTLAKDYRFFLKDSGLIKKEYTKIYSETDYIIGRKKFLINLLNDKIFITEDFKDKEEKAKSNIKKFLKIK